MTTRPPTRTAEAHRWRLAAPGDAGSRFRRSAATTVLMVASGLLLGAMGPVAAQEDEPPTSQLPPQVVIFVIDLSGSMNAPFDDERTKLEVAKEAFAEAFENVSPDAYVGIRVYGDQLPARAPADRRENCTVDTRLVAPIDRVDREQLVQQVQSFEAGGDTAIALALRAANGDIPDGTLGTVVLFSDGRDECFDADLDGDAAVGPSFGEDPCEVAKDIAGEGVDLRIDRVETVGFRADEAAEAELRCIADETGGTYTPIESPEDARELLPELLADISSPREAERLGGEPIVGTPAADGAPELPRLDGVGTAQGRFVDSIDMNSEKWYRASEFGPGGGTFTATVFGLPAQEGITFGLRVYLPATDQTFFAGYSDDDAGLPRRPTASIRCPGCSINGGPHELYWIVGLSTENPALGGTYDLELLTEGPAFGGLSTDCVEPQECWYPAVIATRAQEVADARAEYDAATVEQSFDDLIGRRDALAANLAEARGAADSAAADAAAAAEAAAAAAADAAGERRRADDLVARAEAVGGERSTYTLPLVIGLFGVLAMVGGVVLLTRPRRAVVGAEDDGIDRSAVIGTVSGGPDAWETPSGPAVDDPADRKSPDAERRQPSVEGDAGAATLPPPTDRVGADGLETPTSGTPGDAEIEAPALEDEPTLGVDGSARPSSVSAGGEEVPEPGWYDDPTQPGQVRWWDGGAWTDHAQPDAKGGEQS